MLWWWPSPTPPALLRSLIPFFFFLFSVENEFFVWKINFPTLDFKTSSNSIKILIKWASTGSMGLAEAAGKRAHLSCFTCYIAQHNPLLPQEKQGKDKLKKWKTNLSCECRSRDWAAKTGGLGRTLFLGRFRAKCNFKGPPNENSYHSLTLLNNFISSRPHTVRVILNFQARSTWFFFYFLHFNIFKKKKEVTHFLNY